ncbi:hypothetical protein CcaverHIS002_0705540 [Cutaneotrichosporon cavernicola]|nr:hypothetical protein CcaverHIS002_0705540 [Cutaneotrichosporon cavernicola]
MPSLIVSGDAMVVSKELLKRTAAMPECEGVFDLDGDPTTFPEHVQVYLCLVATASLSDPPSLRPCAFDTFVTDNLMLEGLDILARERAENPFGQGRIFVDAASHTAQQIERMVPGTPHDQTAMFSRFRRGLVLTNVILPIPEALQGVSPPELFHSIVGWLYGDMHPAAIVSDLMTQPQPGTRGLSRAPKVMDLADAVIEKEAVACILREVATTRSLVRRGVLGDECVAVLPWASPSVQVNFPNVAKGDEWLNHIPTAHRPGWC